MKTLTTNLLLSLIVLVAAGCATVFDSAVAIADIRNAALTEWAQLAKAGKTTPEINAAVISADLRAQQAAKAAEAALVAYKASGDSAGYVAALRATKAAVSQILDAIWPLIPVESNQLKTDLAKASTL